MNGPLRKHPTNPHFFTDASGKAIYLAGSTIHGTCQNVYGQPDYLKYLDDMKSYHHNCHRLRTWENGWIQGGAEPPFTPMLYERTGPGLATDGGPKFDLNRLNEEFFALLRKRVIEARDRGIYVIVFFFHSYSVMNDGRDFWGGHPFHKDNNINGLNGDLNGDGHGFEVHTLEIPAITRLQEVYIRKMLDTLNDLDNVIYEIGNELHIAARDFSYYMANFTKAEETKRPKQHLVGVTAMGDWGPPLHGGAGSYEDLVNSPGDWISPAQIEGGNLTNDPPVEERKIVVHDTDHTLGWGLPSVDWVWKSFTRGHHLIFTDQPEDPGVFDRDIHLLEAIRRNTGYALRYAEKMNLAAMRPRNNLSSSSYCLAHPGSEYLVYLPFAGAVTVDLADASGLFSVAWFNPTPGIASEGGSVEGGDKRSFTPPFEGDAVLYLAKTKSPD